MRVWLNGSVMPVERASVSVLDRGFLFGDGVYELVRFFGGTGVGMDDHVRRLRRSLALARIEGFDADDLRAISAALLDDAALDDATVYLQVTRGAGTMRQHVPAPGLRPTVLGMIAAAPSLAATVEPQAVRAVLRPDRRWQRCEIKTTSLMGNILAIVDADEHGADEALLHRGGFVGEGTHTNVLAMVRGRLVTPPVDADPPILHGVTRPLVLAAARDAGIDVDERPLPVHELLAADEVMVTSSRRIAAGVTSIDERPVGDGRVGVATRHVFEACRSRIARECGVAITPAPRVAGPAAPLETTR